MADQPLPNIPYRAPMLDESGMLTQAWSAFFRSLYIRVGQENALTNLELATIAGGGVTQAQFTTLTNTVTANKTADDLQFSNILQGPVL